MNMFTDTGAKTPQEYMLALEEPRKSEIKKLDEFIKETLPGQKRYMQAGMISYGSYHYKYASGKEGDWMYIALSSRKNYISLYACGAVDGKYVAEKYKKELPKTSIGKSCIRFRKLEDVDFKVLKKILLETVKSGGLSSVGS